MRNVFARAWLFLLNLSVREEGIETIEWVALGAVLALTIAAIMAVLTPGGQQIGQSILSGIMKWASKIGGG